MSAAESVQELPLSVSARCAPVESRQTVVDPHPSTTTPTGSQKPVQRRTRTAQGRSLAKPTGYCAACGNSWADPDAAHCDRCHRTLKSAAVWDQHRKTCP